MHSKIQPFSKEKLRRLHAYPVPMLTLTLALARTLTLAVARLLLRVAACADVTVEIVRKLPKTRLTDISRRTRSEPVRSPNTSLG